MHRQLHHSSGFEGNVATLLSALKVWLGLGLIVRMATGRG